MYKNNNFGIIQGRLSPIYNGQIQAFPWDHWRDEFKLMNDLGLKILEWTLDQERVLDNPFMTKDGQNEILSLMNKYNIRIDSLTADFFMHKPFFKYEGEHREELLSILKKVLESCDVLGVRLIVIPLVDNGSVESNPVYEEIVRSELTKLMCSNEFKVRVCFESDYGPEELATFINTFPDSFSINYDIGNSASLGHDPERELSLYGKRVTNVHIKDRVLNGKTVPLGEGDANFEAVFSALESVGYIGNLIFQSARASSDDHVGAIQRYKEFVINKLG